MLCTLTLLVHLSGYPAFERRERFQNMSLSDGPQIIAAWTEDHDGWVVSRWRCGRG